MAPPPTLTQVERNMSLSSCEVRILRANDVTRATATPPPLRVLEQQLRLALHWADSKAATATGHFSPVTMLWSVVEIPKDHGKATVAMGLFLLVIMLQ
eukprot:gnl/TRDRNA2_/TRDRNA2_162431_c1_seq3.p2 gnl/TRDRNA2_/TRDRNA2_162431_c1~~gnl/TRDRNA2_/TRDRNA2_162431_c1_seq3.p2  ORF type:complete len:105 (+),score=19.89 gnl/TRDRNA2_/TRDRNA2_162431_c1_seq3:22-315(+)